MYKHSFYYLLAVDLYMYMVLRPLVSMHQKSQR